MKRIIRNIARLIVSYYHYFISLFAGHKLQEVPKEEIINEFKKLGYINLCYPLQYTPLRPDTLDLSIIIPVYNCSAFIGYCLDSIFRQKTKYSFEVICVNDGSKDNSLQILYQYKEKYNDKLIVIDQENGGASKARNTGIDKARGEFLAFIDSDDFVFDGYIDILMENAISKNADIVQSGYCKVLPSREVYRNCPNKDIVFSISDKKEVYQTVSGYIWASVIRKRLFEDVRFAVGAWYEDMITRNLIMRRAKKFCSISNCLYAYTYNPNSLTTSTWDSVKIKTLDHFFLMEKIHSQGKNHLGLKDDSLYLNVVLTEFSRIMENRLRKQPVRIKKQVFLLMADFVKNLEIEDMEFLSNDNKTIYESIVSLKYDKWYHYSLYMSLKYWR